MKKILHHGVTRWVARLLAPLCLLAWSVPPAWAYRTARRPEKFQATTEALREKIAAREAREKKKPDARTLSYGEMLSLSGRGQYRNKHFSGVLPWQRSFRDVNMCNGNLFKSFTDIQVPPARGAGLAWQRTYNSSDDRVGPFGIGWTHAYDIRMEEADPNDEGNDNQPIGLDKAARSDFFGGKHNYRRDADGLYSPPPYMFDELSSEYIAFLESGPQVALTDEQIGIDGTKKHFFKATSERFCDWIEDRHGNRTTLAYTQNGNYWLLNRVSDPSGRYLEPIWTNFGTAQAPIWRITEVKGPINPSTGLAVYTVTCEYNAEFNLWKVHQDPAGLNRITTYGYTTVSAETGLLASIADPLNHTVSYLYELKPLVTNTLWVTQVTEPGSGGNHVWTISVTLDTFGGPEIVTHCSDNSGPPNLVMYVVSSLQLRVTDIAQTAGVPLYSWQYDSQNNVTRHEDSAIWKDGSGGQQNSNNRAVVMTYGPHGNVITQSVDGFPGETTSTSYWNGSKYFQKDSVTDALGRVSRFEYFDKYDPAPGNRGNVRWVRDARYSTSNRQFEYSYNAYGQKSQEKNLNNVLTNLTYGDSWGNLTQVVQDPGGLNRTTAMTYDVAGRVVNSTDPKSQLASFTFNGVGQPLTAAFAGENISYGYGGNGRTETVTDGRGTTTIGYEAGNDRVASVSDPVTGTVGYTYRLAGERLTMSLPGGGVWNYEYDNIWQSFPKDDPNSVGFTLRKITDDQGRIVNYYPDSQGHPREVFFNQSFDGTGALVSYCRAGYLQDSNGAGTYTNRWLKQIRNSWHWKDGMGVWQQRSLVQNDYTYSTIGNRLTNAISDVSGLIRTEQYGYDELSRLTSANYGDGENQAYGFDPMSNRLSKTVNSVTENYTYNNANMLLTRGSNNYVNDLNGNTTSGGGRTSTWDAQNRMTACLFGGVTTNHAYGADGLRKRTTKGTEITDFVLDGQMAVRTFVNSAVNETHLTGPRGPEYQRRGAGSPVWYLYDGLGSVTGTVDSAGNIVSTRKYDVYGTVRGSTGPSGTKHKFVGSLGHPSEDETGLIYMRARYCDPVTGRFMSEDPGQDGSNWLQYCEGDPVGYYDSTGTVKELPIPGMPGWTFRLDRPYLAGKQYLQDVALKYKGKDMGSFVIGQKRWKHGPFGQIPGGVRSWAKGKFGTTLGVSSVVAYLEQNPLDFIAIMFDIAGEHETAAQIDAINSGMF